MALIEWNRSLSVRVNEMDLQHQKLFSLINDLNEAIKAGKAEDEMNHIFDALSNYTIEHFTAEELYLESIDYPELESQKTEHKVFVQSIADYKTMYNESDPMASMRLIVFLTQWIINHIQNSDMKYGEFVHQFD